MQHCWAAQRPMLSPGPRCPAKLTAIFAWRLGHHDSGTIGARPNRVRLKRRRQLLGRVQKERMPNVDATIVGAPPPHGSLPPPSSFPRCCTATAVGRQRVCRLGVCGQGTEVGRCPRGGNQPLAPLGKEPHLLPPTPGSPSQPRAQRPWRGSERRRQLLGRARKEQMPDADTTTSDQDPAGIWRKWTDTSGPVDRIGSPEPVGRRLLSADQGPRPQPAHKMPLRETRGAQVVGKDGTLQEGGPVYYYQPFTTTDILNWKHHTPAYSEKPQAMIDLLETIFQTQKPTWVDRKQLLFTFFNTEERMRVVTEARKWFQTQTLAGILDTDRWARKAFPDEEPDWNPNSEDGRTGLERYHLAFIQGVRAEPRSPPTWLKSLRFSRSLMKSPAAFYERLCEAYWIYTPFRPEAPENQTMVNAVFVGQVQPDIRRKLQKLEGFAGKNATELLEIANKVFINRDSAARKEEEKRIQRRANIIAAAFRGSGSQTD
ncbi:hypothetical protein QTO34_000659 [Cnephaeus nilssonii]|uniref:Core shell protein Gag P30 domain-containing protein n=1 Tax=Cnephaeus nilssonii TaxID=3371016 RepID=A0AA40LX35_CNENI|nr:hypothetical protein QTO34_000659 [Eptesicus nilssonii]